MLIFEYQYIMKPTKKIALIITLVAFVSYALYDYSISRWQGRNDLINSGIIEEIDDLSNARTSKFETKGTISGIELHLEGRIDGSGIIKIGENDSTVYKKYELNTRVIGIEFKSDWYSEFCVVSFEPITRSNGKIRILCNFIGD